MHASVLAVIPTLNEEAAIEDVIRQLRRGLDGLDVKFVVADGGSSDATLDIVGRLSREYADLSVLGNPKRFQSAGVNLAARLHGESRDFLVRCDAHATYPPGYIAKLVAMAGRTGADAVVVALDSHGGGIVQEATALVSDTPVGSGGSRHRGGRSSGFVDHGHHALFVMAAFTAIGGYDESFACNEDAELDCRLTKAGRKIYLDADNRVTYYPRKSFGRLARQYYKYGFGRARTIKKHPHSIRLRQLLVPAGVFGSLLGLMMSIFYPIASLPLALYLAVLILTSAWLAVRSRKSAAWLAGVAAGTMHVCWAVGLAVGLVTRASEPELG